MNVKHCGLLGEKLVHSFSPQIHALMSDYDYKLFEIPPEKVQNFIKSNDWDAINVTIPYKQTVIPFLDYVSPTAQRIGSVNTIVRDKDNKLCGYNTDFYGFSFLLKHGGFEIEQKKCIILGSGGSCKTVKCVLQDMGAKEIVIISRNGQDNYNNISKHYDAQIIVNTTPVGMYPNNQQKIIELSNFKNCQGVVDLIYNPSKTALLLDAEKLSIKYSNGLPMLVAQAKKACEIFQGISLQDDIITNILSKLTLQMKNIVLIGMPGCGKTTIAQALANRLCRTAADTDDIISQMGRSPAEIINNDGEDAFRALETQVVCQVGKESSKIISTGGGVVTRPENYDPLHQNGVIIFIQRDLQDLSCDNRPITQKSGVQKLYSQRLGLYEFFADAVIKNDASPEEAVDKIIEVLENLI